MSDQRFIFKLANGKHTKIRKNELYNFTLENGLEISFQEQPAHVGEPVHTHVWVDPKNNDGSMYILDYILRESMYYPIKFRTLAFLQFWHLENDEFTEDTDTLVEFIVDRKLSKTMSNGIMNWIEEIYEIVTGFQIMNNLFDHLKENT